MPPLAGGRLAMAALVLGLANFLVLLDSTIANVSLAHISGSLGVSTTQGTWIITSYAVAEAICVPLTGWLAARFGTLRTFTVSLAGFTIFSTLCGLSPTLGMLIACRVAQGLCGGPLMPLSQTLLLRVFPRAKAGLAMSVAAMTTIVAPILGPILGGSISDNWSWPWIFFINLPPAALCMYGVLKLLKPYETPVVLRPIDLIGLALLIFWVGAFQLLLDLGRERDWFGSPTIVGLAVAAGVGFVAFLIWELTDRHPIVDLRVLRHRGFTAGAVALAVGFGTIYSSVVLVPLFLQSVVGYTSTQSGYAMSAMGLFAILLAPVAGRLPQWGIDMRPAVCLGLMWLGAVSFLRSRWSVELDFWSYTMPQLLQGLGTPFFMIGLMTLALGSVPPSETASAAGLMAFLRTLGTALATSVATSVWADGTQTTRAALTGEMNTAGFSDQLASAGITSERSSAMLERMVEQQGAAISASHLFITIGVLCVLVAQLAWLIPKVQQSRAPVPAH